MGLRSPSSTAGAGGAAPAFFRSTSVRRLRLSVGLLVAVGCLLVTPHAKATDPQPGVLPDTWRPYDLTSPLNVRLPSRLKVHPQSEAIVAELLRHGPVSAVRTGHAGTDRDFGKALYRARQNDPVFTIRCVEFGGRCPVEGHRVRIPEAARPSGGSDAHLAVVDQTTGWEYDFWSVRAKPRGGGVLSIGWGGRTRIAGDGTRAGATAAGFGLAGSVLRGGELAAGRVDHALTIAVPCTSGRTVWPASGDSVGATCASFGLDGRNAPDIGARLALRMSDAEIRALPLPAWKRALLQAIAHYGMFVGDTLGPHSGVSFSLDVESGDSYAAFGLTDPMLALAHRSLGDHVDLDRSHPGEYLLDLDAGVNWRDRLVVVN